MLLAVEPRAKLIGVNHVALEVGDLVGTIGATEVRSLFAGTVMGFIAVDGERVMASQPIAWLRTS